jgi:hypothetical protein
LSLLIAIERYYYFKVSRVYLWDLKIRQASLPTELAGLLRTTSDIVQLL